MCYLVFWKGQIHQCHTGIEHNQVFDKWNWICTMGISSEQLGLLYSHVWSFWSLRPHASEYNVHRNPWAGWECTDDQKRQRIGIFFYLLLFIFCSVYRNTYESKLIHFTSTSKNTLIMQLFQRTLLTSMYLYNTWDKLSKLN